MRCGGELSTEIASKIGLAKTRSIGVDISTRCIP